MSADLQTQRERRRLFEQFVGLLTERAREFETIGRRVTVFEHVLQIHDGTASKSKDLARRMEVSEARISIAIRDTSGLLDELLKS